MLFSHFLHTHVCTDNNNTEIWWQTSETIYGCLKIFFVTAKINDWDNFMTFLNDFFPIFVFILVESFRKDLFSILIETHDFMSNRTCSSCLLFVEIVEYSNTCRAITIILNTFCKNRNESGFTCIDITNNTKL